MIWRLFREQWRAHRTSSVVVGLLAAAAVGVGGFTVAHASWVAASGEYAEAMEANGVHGASIAIAGTGAAGAVEGSGTTTLTATELAALLDDASSQGIDAWATLCAGADTIPASLPSGPRGATTEACATWGATPWESLLATGTAPEPGQIVISAASAKAHGWSIGDTVEVTAYGPEPSVPLSAVISGLLFDAPDGSWQVPVGAYVNGADAAAVLALAPPELGEWGPTAQVTWDGDLAPDGLTAEWSQSPYRRTLDLGTSTPVVAGFALAIGAVVASLAGARRAATARRDSLATARALGASRSQVAGAALIEAGLVWMLGAVGGAVGVLAAFAAHASWRRDVVAPAPVGLGLGWWTVATVAVMAAALSVITSSTFAGLALKATPTALLKGGPATPSPGAWSAWRLVALTGVTALAATAWAIAQDHSRDTTRWSWSAGAVAVLLAATLAYQLAARASFWVGGALGRATRPLLVTIGVLMREGAHKAAALVLTPLLLIGGAATLLTYVLARQTAGDVDLRMLLHGVSESGMVTPVLGTLVIAVAVGTVIAQSLGSAGDLTQVPESLGASRAASRLAASLADALPQTVGAVLGAAIGPIVGATAWVLGSDLPGLGASALVSISVSLTVIALGALVVVTAATELALRFGVAWTMRSGNPVDQVRDAIKQGAR